MNDIDKLTVNEKDRATIIKLPLLLFQRVIISVQGIKCNMDLEAKFSFKFCIFPQPFQKILAQ